jgi:4-amino-4-deoxy-L-arabinose transferase-like glycosyltransferase
MPARTRATASRWALIAGLACGLAALAKGPVAWVIVGSVLLAWRTLGLRADGQRAYGRSLVWSLVLALGPVALWAGLVALLEPELLEPLFYGQHLGRAIEGKAHAGPFWKHAMRLPGWLLPWTLPILLGWLRGLGAIRLRGDAASEGERDGGLARAAVWLGVLFVFFSAIPVKRDLYLLPAYPAAALLGARWLSSAWHVGLPRLVGWTGVAFLGLVAGICCLTLPAATLSDVEVLRRIVELDVGLELVAVGVVFAVGTLLAARAVRTGRGVAWTSIVLGTCSLGIGLGMWFVLPAVDPLKSPRQLAGWIAVQDPIPERIPCLDVQPGGYRFYGRIPTQRSEDLGPELRRDGDGFLGLASRQAFDRLPQEQRERYRIVHRAGVGSREVLVLRAANASH